MSDEIECDPDLLHLPILVNYKDTSHLNMKTNKCMFSAHIPFIISFFLLL